MGGADIGGAVGGYPVGGGPTGFPMSSADIQNAISQQALGWTMPTFAMAPPMSSQDIQNSLAQQVMGASLGDILSGGSGVPGGTYGRTGEFKASGLTGLLHNLSGGWRQLLGQSKPAVFGDTPGQESLNRIGATGMGGGFSWSGLAKSPLAKAGAGTVGMMLATQGLLGQNRGTVGGMFEGMFGGAGVGFAYGGPLGAAIGAGAGLLIGAGEMIAGVESPRNEAKRLVTSMYHISINNSTADQIVNIANQTYAGHVSIAVRSPEVRRMLGLYAAGTGQAGLYNQGVTQQHGASLVESGGNLFQQATYQYGQAYTYGSNLPVYGGSPTHVLGAPGGGVQLSLNIAGQDAAKFLQGNVVSPDVVQNQLASANNSSNGRVSQALMMSEPGSIAS